MSTQLTIKAYELTACLHEKERERERKNPRICINRNNDMTVLGHSLKIW